jgi:hypothetical protein
VQNRLAIKPPHLFHFCCYTRRVNCSRIKLKESHLASHYLDWDNIQHREILLKGPEGVADHCRLNELQQQIPVIAFNEIHKYSKWKIFLKGFFDTYEEQCKIIAQGTKVVSVELDH